MNTWWEIASVFLLSSVKFVFGGVPLALGFGFSFFETVTVTTLGGCSGVLFFTYASEKIIALYQKYKEKKIAVNPGKYVEKKPSNKKKIIKFVRERFGLVGFSLLVPFFIPLPIGCFIAVRYFKDKQRIVRFLFLSLFIWSVIGTLLYKPLFDAIRNYFF